MIVSFLMESHWLYSSACSFLVVIPTECPRKFPWKSNKLYEAYYYVSLHMTGSVPMMSSANVVHQILL